MNNTYTFEDIFRGRMFRIPDYQRGYAWEPRHWNDLIEDLELLSPGRNHYTGTLVVRKTGEAKFRDEGGQSYEVFDVIDGQQRLTTIVIFLDSIHDELERLDKTAMAGGLEKMYLAILDRNGQPQTKLTLNRDSQAFFYDNVLGFSPSVEGTRIRSHDNLLNAHQRMDTYLSEQAAKRGAAYADWLVELSDKITQGLIVLLHEVENETDAGVIFETMNDRGKVLTDLEKVKNHLLYLASKLELDDPHDLNERINTTWNRIFEELMASGLGDDENESQLLRVHWLMVYDALPANWKRYQTIKERFNLKSYYQRHTELLADLVDYLDSLRNTVTAYCDIYNPHRAGAFNEFMEPMLRAQIVEAQDKLVRAGVRATFLPLLVAVRLKAHDDGHAYLQVLELSEKFDFRVYQWLRARASAGQSIFFRLGNQFYRRPDVDSVSASITRTIVEYCTNARFEEKFSRETEDWYHWYGLKYFLYEYEQHLAAQEREPVRMHWDVLTDTKRDTIEHILPQTPTEAWLEAFPDELLRKRWTHDIGNLTLTFDNSSLQNKSFQEKKGEPSLASCYAGSSFFVERQLAEYTRWTEVELRQRREQIKTWALARWHIDEDTVETPGTDDPSERIALRAEDGGVSNEYLTLVKFAADHHFHHRAFQKSMMIAPSTKRTIALFTLWPREGFVDVWIGFASLEEHLHIPHTKPQEIFETEKMDWHEFVNSANLDEFIQKMERLFA